MKAYELALHEAVMNREVAVKEREMALKEREITTKERETIAKILEELMAIRETLIHTQAYGTGKVLLTALEEKVLGVLGGI